MTMKPIQIPPIRNMHIEATQQAAVGYQNGFIALLILTIIALIELTAFSIQIQRNKKHNQITN